jgi:hypothetical protein
MLSANVSLDSGHLPLGRNTITKHSCIFKQAFHRKASVGTHSIQFPGYFHTEVLPRNYKGWEPSPLVLIFFKSYFGFFQGHISFKDRCQGRSN